MERYQKTFAHIEKLLLLQDSNIKIQFFYNGEKLKDRNHYRKRSWKGFILKEETHLHKCQLSRAHRSKREVKLNCCVLSEAKLQLTNCVFLSGFTNAAMDYLF